MAHIIIPPSPQTPAFNAIPISVQDTNSLNPWVENNSLSINIVYYPNRLLYEITPTGPNSAKAFFDVTSTFSVGGQVFFLDRTTADGYYTGYYTVLSIDEDTGDVEFDMSITIPFPASTGYADRSYFYNYIRYKMEAGPNGLVEIDIHNTVKDFVGTALTYIFGFDYLYPAGNEVFEYAIVVGNEYNYVFPFVDNLASGGFVAFYSPQVTSVAECLFKVGDVVNITQDMQEWDYTDNFFSSGYLAFTNGTSSDGHNFQAGDLVYVTGQSTYPSANGPVRVVSAPDIYNLVVDKTFPGSTPAEPGKIYGNPTPQYDGIATITNIYYEPLLSSVVIVTDKVFDESTQPISGKIRLANNYKFATLAEETSIIFPLDELPIYSYAHMHRFDKQVYARYFNETAIVPYIGLSQKWILGASDKYWSTILPQEPGQYNRATIDGDSFLLFRQQADFLGAPISAAFCLLTCYDATNTLLGQAYLDITSAGISMYVPGNLKRWIDFGSVDIGSFDLATQMADVMYYDLVILSDPSGTGVPDEANAISRHIYFKMDTDCSSLPTFDLCWLDAFGSYITFPFRYLATKSSDVDRSIYTKKEGEFSYFSRGSEIEGGGYVEDYAGRGDNTYYVKGKDQFQLTSGWLQDKENILFEDLMLSADVYMRIPEDSISGVDSSSQMYAVTLQPNTIEYKTNRAGDFIFNYSPKAVLAHNNYRFNNWNRKAAGGGKK